MGVETAALLSRSFDTAIYVLVAFITVYGLLAALWYYYRFRPTFTSSFQTDLTDEHDIYLPVPAFQGEFLVSLGDFRKDYIGKVSITGFAQDVPVGSFCSRLEKPNLVRIRSAHLAKSPEPIVVPYIFDEAVTKLKLRLELEPAWTGRWHREFGIYPEKGAKEVVRVAVNERRT